MKPINNQSVGAGDTNQQIDELEMAKAVAAELFRQVIDLRQEIARYKEREKTMGWNQS